MRALLKSAIFLFLLVTFSMTAQSQKLKDLLYSKKLKSDSGTVVRKTDDLSTKIDTVQKKTVDSSKLVGKSKDSSKNEVKVEAEAETEVEESDATTSTEKKTPVKSNTKIWREYTDSMTVSLKDLLDNKKIKKGTYFLLIEYDLETDGRVTVTKVTSTPENALLQSQVDQYLSSYPPTMSPSKGSDGQPKKVKRKQSFTVTKD